MSDVLSEKKTLIHILVLDNYNRALFFRGKIKVLCSDGYTVYVPKKWEGTFVYESEFTVPEEYIPVVINRVMYEQVGVNQIESGDILNFSTEKIYNTNGSTRNIFFYIVRLKNTINMRFNDKREIIALSLERAKTLFLAHNSSFTSYTKYIVNKAIKIKADKEDLGENICLSS